MTSEKTNASERIAFRRKWMTDAITDGSLMDDSEYVQYIRADLVPQWQDIETAPKDDLIDIWLKDGVRWCDCYYDRICSEWRTSRPSGHLVRINESHVTHWMPLPNPPEPK